MNECLNEVIILMVSYVLILTSDFVPIESRDIREMSGYFMIGTISATALYFIGMIIKNAVTHMIDQYRLNQVIKHKKYQLEKRVNTYQSNKNVLLKIYLKIMKYQNLAVNNENLIVSQKKVRGLTRLKDKAIVKQGGLKDFITNRMNDECADLEQQQEIKQILKETHKINILNVFE